MTDMTHTFKAVCRSILDFVAPHNLNLDNNSNINLNKILENESCSRYDFEDSVVFYSEGNSCNLSVSHMYSGDNYYDAAHNRCRNSKIKFGVSTNYYYGAHKPQEFLAHVRTCVKVAELAVALEQTYNEEYCVIMRTAEEIEKDKIQDEKDRIYRIASNISSNNSLHMRVGHIKFLTTLSDSEKNFPNGSYETRVSLKNGNSKEFVVSKYNETDVILRRTK